ncbi:MAG: GH3 auxin-responsive promoter family protein [Planctomycetota bacterium]
MPSRVPPASRAATPGDLSWTSLVGAGLSLRVARRRRVVADRARWQRGTARIQADTLRALLTKAQRTAFGREHGFGRLASIAGDADLERAYREAVPLRDWLGFQDHIARMREAGEPDVLWPGLVKRFAQTSGTTAGDKFIPVSDEMMRSNYRASLDIFCALIARGVSIPRMMGGRCLFLGGSSDLRAGEHGIVTADLSGLVTPLIRWPLSTIYSPGPEIALLSDWPEKLEAMAELSMRQDIRFISGMPSWAGVLMQRVLEKTAEPTIRDVWPNLSVFVHGGVKYDPFRARVAELYSGDAHEDIPVRHELYPASEAFVAMQDTPGDPGMRLLADIGVHYEFVPFEQIDSDAPEAFTAGEVERGQKYVVVLSSCAGLWRYVLGDLVEFDDVPDGLEGRPGTGPARLRIVGRHRHFINAFGENLIGEHIEAGVARAARETGLSHGEFTAAPVYPGEGRRAGLELVIEIDPGAGPDALAAFVRTFDAGVKAENVDYTTKRADDVGMAPPTLTPVPPGTFHAWMASRGKLGGQHKCPRCANHREIVDSVRLAAPAQP